MHTEHTNNCKILWSKGLVHIIIGWQVVLDVLTMKVKNTLLSTQHRTVCSTVVAFFVLLLAFAHQKVITEKTICQSPMFSDRVLNFQKILFGAISGVCYLNFCKYIRGSFRLEGGDSFHSAERMSLFFCFLSAISGFLQFIEYFETTCEVWHAHTHTKTHNKPQHNSHVTFNNLHCNDRISTGSNRLFCNGSNGSYLFPWCFTWILF